MERLTIFFEQLFVEWGMAHATSVILSHITLALLAIIAALAVGFICSRLIVPVVMKISDKTMSKWDDIIFNKKVLVSASQIVPAVIIWTFLPAMFYRYPTVEILLGRLTAVYITVMSVKTVITLVNSFKMLDETVSTATRQYVHTFCGVMKIVALFVGVIIIVAIVIDKSPIVLLAGLGATSAVLMLIFQDTIKGLVAGIRLTSNDMLHKGNWITVPKAGIDGVVIEITLTTVKVRNWDNTILTISPQTLVDDSFQNWRGMQESDGRRVKRKVYYDFSSIGTVDATMCKSLIKKGYFKSDEIRPGMTNITLYRRYMERFLSKTAAVNKDMIIMVRQLEATNTGLPIEFYFFLTDKTWVNYEHNLADIMDSIYAITPEFGLRIFQLQYGNQV